MTRGCFIAVVGPSGAGKDSLIREAMQVRRDLVLARRAITRPSAPESEDFESLSTEEFQRREATGAFALHWQAHGLNYGIPTSVEEELAAGQSVIANLSRGMIDVARARFDPFRAIVVTASVEILAVLHHHQPVGQQAHNAHVVGYDDGAQPQRTHQPA